MSKTQGQVAVPEFQKFARAFPKNKIKFGFTNVPAEKASGAIHKLNIYDETGKIFLGAILLSKEEIKEMFTVWKPEE